MLLNVLDAQGLERTVYWKSQQTPTDRSDTIASTGVSQPVMVANLNRGGFLFQNNGIADMRLSEIGGDPLAVGAIVIHPGETFPPKDYPIPTTAMNVSGSQGDAYTAREW